MSTEAPVKEETLFDRLGLEKINPLVDTIYKNTEQIFE